jgi:DNA-directed RNA polymerase specialized sigma24 family protein
VCRSLWLQKLKKRKAVFDQLKDVEEFIELPQEMLTEASIRETEMHRIIQIHLLSMPEDCQKVLRLFAKKVQLREIARIMGFKTENYTKTRNNLCKQDLTKRIADDPRSSNFLNHEKPN